MGVTAPDARGTTRASRHLGPGHSGAPVSSRGPFPKRSSARRWRRTPLCPLQRRRRRRAGRHRRRGWSPVLRCRYQVAHVVHADCILGAVVDTEHALVLHGHERVQVYLRVVHPCIEFNSIDAAHIAGASMPRTSTIAPSAPGTAAITGANTKEEQDRGIAHGSREYHRRRCTQRAWRSPIRPRMLRHASRFFGSPRSSGFAFCM